MSRPLCHWAIVAIIALTSCACVVPKVGSCGPGLVLLDGVCVGDPDASTCGPGTVLVEGVCVLAGDAGGTGDDAGPRCAPQCDGRGCGPDGCGGLCGACDPGLTCSTVGQCVDGPGCLASCAERQCGDDGCGGSCGDCGDPATPVCNAAGVCVAFCIPDCVGRACGGDGCGGVCGACDAGSACSTLGHCVPEGWTCDPTMYASHDQCDCGCGASDPDCALPHPATVGCEAYHACADGSCQPLLPASWSCPAFIYDDGVLCDCGCGAPDPDCLAGGLLVTGCSEGETCDQTDTCVPCVSDCAGATCGDDGCGGSCGACAEGLACVEGGCVEGCLPTPLVCETSTCGDDGCGGSCGSCPANSFCAQGQCVVAPGMSCTGHCNAFAPGGCGCDPGCAGQADCCPDYVAECVCVPSCEGKVCGDDGCGGACGACGAGAPFCDAAGQCSATCTPSCAPGGCGDDGCGATCPSCDAGLVCSELGRCVPDTWHCPGSWYGDNGTCDCGCGTVDLDCQSYGLTSGCPLGASCDGISGFCDIAFCGGHGACKAPNWCVGHYLAGDGRRRGVCQPPEPSGQPAGNPCSSDFACATGVCAAGVCREHCLDDGDCGGGESCIGFAFVDGLTLAPLGVASLCDGGAELAELCASQQQCGASRTCLVVIDAATLLPSYRCGKLAGGDGDEGSSCGGNFQCEVGLVCAGEKCMRPCPGGQADCPAWAVCGVGTLHGAAAVPSDDDVLAAVCVPK